MTTYAIHDECRSDWSHQVSAVAIIRWLQHDQTIPLSAKGVTCKTRRFHGQYWILSLTSKNFTLKLSEPVYSCIPPPPLSLSLSLQNLLHIYLVIYVMNDSRSCLLLVTFSLFYVIVKARAQRMATRVRVCNSNRSP